MSSPHDASLVRIQDSELARDIERARMRLLLDQPSLAAAVMRVPVVQVESDILPAGIGAARGAIVVSQALRLKHADDIAYGYAHNMIHCLFEHIDRRGSRDRRPWGLAIDIATAAMLDPMLDPQARDEGPESDFRPDHSAQFRQLVTAFGDLSCEQIFDKLVRPDSARDARSPNQQRGQMAWRSPRPPEPRNLASSQSDPSFEGDLSQSGHGYDLEVALSGDASLSSEDRALILQEVAQSVNSDPKLAGTVRGNWRQLATRLRTRSVPWERVFAERLEGLVPTDYQNYPFSKRHLWRGVYLPSIARKGIGRVLFAIDTSGSMSIRVLGEIADQIDQLRNATACSLTLVHFDTVVQRVSVFDEFDDPLNDPGKSNALEMHGRGGTDLRVPFDFANGQLERGERLSAIIIATDGCGPLPTLPPSIPVIWLVPDADAVCFSPPFGAVIRCGGSESGGAHAA